MSIDKYLRVRQVSEIVGLSRASIYAMEKAGTFPKKIALGARAVAWLESEVKKWMEARKGETKTGREAKPGDPLESAAKRRNKKKDNALAGASKAVANSEKRSDVERINASGKSSSENGCDLISDNPLLSDKGVAAEASGHPQSQKPAKHGRNRSGPIVDLVKLAFPQSSRKTR